MSIRIQNLSVWHEKNVILHDISFDINPGEIVALLGANGAGKSTLCHAIAGHDIHTEGHIYVEDMEVTQTSPLTLSRHRAFLSQNIALEFNLSVKEVVEMGIYPFPEIRHADEIITRALNYANVATLEARPYLDLSGGEQQRVQLARIIAQLLAHAHVFPTSPQYCLLDEPTANLDPKYQQQLFVTLRSLCKALSLGVLIVVHDVNLAAFYADRLLLLADGRLLTQGTPKQTLSPDNLQAVYKVKGYPITHPFYSDKMLVVWNKPDLDKKGQSFSD